MAKPTQLKCRGEVYKAVVMKVVGADANGRPRKLEALYDEESTHIEGGEEFLVVFVLEKCVRKRTN